jgi:hypothetical protein
VRDARWTYVSYLPTGEVELYDRRRDPFQLRNLADDPAHAGVVRELQRRLTVLQGCAAQRCQQRFGPPPRPDGRRS